MLVRKPLARVSLHQYLDTEESSQRTTSPLIDDSDGASRHFTSHEVLLQLGRRNQKSAAAPYVMLTLCM